MSAAQRIALCKTDEVAVGAAIKVETNGLTLAVFNVGGRFYVMDDMCTHGPGSLSEGYIEDDVVECDFHNGAFNIRTGEGLGVARSRHIVAGQESGADGSHKRDANHSA